MPRRRASRAVRWTILLVIAAAACSKRAAPEPPRTGGTLRVAVLEALDPPGPLYAVRPVSKQLGDHVVPPLGRIDEQGTIQLYLASDYTDRGGSTDFRIRPVFWEDGARVVSQDICTVFDLMRDSRVRSPERPRTDLLRACVSRDDSTLRLEYPTIFGRRRRDALVAPLPSHLPAWPAGADTQTTVAYGGPVLACGPFRIVALDRGHCTLVRHDASGFPPARLDSVRVERHDAAAAASAFAAGRFDAVIDLPSHEVQTARRRRGARAIALVGESYVFVGWNLRDRRFADPAVRRAAAMAVDTRRMIESLTLGQGDPARGPLTALAGFADTTKLLPHDVHGARDALQRAGWIDSDGDGVRDRRGARLDFHLLAPSDDRLRLEAARAVARDLQAIGMRVQLRELNGFEIAQRLGSGSFEAFVGQWFPDADALDAVWRSDAVERLNFVRYASARTDSLLTRLAHELDRPDREILLSRFQAHVYDEQPYLFLFQNPHWVLLGPEVRGAVPTVMSPFWNLPEWWLARRGG